jgi:hypothetical protein
LKDFGCASYVHDVSDTQNKLDAKSRKCCFVGYGDEAFNYRFWDDQNRKIIRSRNVTFIEYAMYKERSSAKLDITRPKSKNSEFLNLDKLSKSTIQREKKFVEVKLDEQRSLMDECDDEEFSKDS